MQTLMLKSLFCDSIIRLHCIKCLASVVDGMKHLIFLLPKHYTNCRITSITHKLEWKFLVWSNQNRSFYQLLLQELECLQTLLIKHKLHVFFQKATQGSYSLGGVLNKSPIEPYMPYKASNSPHSDGWWQFFNDFHLALSIFSYSGRFLPRHNPLSN